MAARETNHHHDHLHMEQMINAFFISSTSTKLALDNLTMEVCNLVMQWKYLPHKELKLHGSFANWCLFGVLRFYTHLQKLISDYVINLKRERNVEDQKGMEAYIQDSFEAWVHAEVKRRIQREGGGGADIFSEEMEGTPERGQTCETYTEETLVINLKEIPTEDIMNAPRGHKTIEKKENKAIISLVEEKWNLVNKILMDHDVYRTDGMCILHTEIAPKLRMRDLEYGHTQLKRKLRHRGSISVFAPNDRGDRGNLNLCEEELNTYEEVPVHFEEYQIPCKENMSPHEEDPVSWEEDVNPYEEGSDSCENDPVPYDEDRTPDKGYLNVYEDKIPFEKNMNAQEEDQIAFVKYPVPFEEDFNPCEEDLVSCEEYINTYDEGPVPYEKNVNPYGENNINAIDTVPPCSKELTSSKEIPLFSEETKDPSACNKIFIPNEENSICFKDTKILIPSNKDPDFCEQDLIPYDRDTAPCDKDKIIYKEVMNSYEIGQILCDEDMNPYEKYSVPVKGSKSIYDDPVSCEKHPVPRRSLCGENEDGMSCEDINPHEKYPVPRYKGIMPSEEYADPCGDQIILEEDTNSYEEDPVSYDKHQLLYEVDTVPCEKVLLHPEDPLLYEKRKDDEVEEEEEGGNYEELQHIASYQERYRNHSITEFELSTNNIEQSVNHSIAEFIIPNNSIGQLDIYRNAEYNISSKNTGQDSKQEEEGGNCKEELQQIASFQESYRHHSIAEFELPADNDEKHINYGIAEFIIHSSSIGQFNIHSSEEFNLSNDNTGQDSTHTNPEFNLLADNIKQYRNCQNGELKLLSDNLEQDKNNSSASQHIHSAEQHISHGIPTYHGSTDRTEEHSSSFYETIPEDEVIPIGALPCIQLPLPYIPSDGLKTEVFLSCVENPGHFYVILGRDGPDLAKMISQHLKEVHENDLEALKVRELPLGSCWAARLADGTWHRVRIIANISHTDSKDGAWRRVNVVLVDSGQSAEVSLKHIRLLHDSFTVQPCFALLCHLAEVYPVNGWLDDPWRVEDTQAFIDICGGFRSPVSAFIQPVNLSMSHGVVLERSDDVLVNVEMVRHQHAMSKLIYEFIERESTGEIREPENTPDDQIYVSMADWNPMREDFMSADNTVQYNNECAESVFCGHCNTDEMRHCKYHKAGKWCPRGEACPWEHVEIRVGGITTEKKKALDMSFPSTFLPPEGSTLAVTVTAVISPSHFYIHLPFGTKCISGPDLDDMNQNQETDLVVLLSSMVKHYSNNSNGRMSSYRSRTLPAPGELMVVLEVLEGMEGQGEGVDCSRVMVLEVDQSLKKECLAKVFFIDFGYEEWVKEETLLPMAPQFAYLPPHAAECWLNGVSSPNGGWNEGAAEYLRKITLHCTLLAEVVEMDRDRQRLGVMLTDNNGKTNTNINEDFMKWLQQGH